MLQCNNDDSYDSPCNPGISWNIFIIGLAGAFFGIVAVRSQAWKQQTTFDSSNSGQVNLPQQFFELMTLHYATFFEQWCSNLCHFLEFPELPLPGSMAWHMTVLTQLPLYSVTRWLDDYERGYRAAHSLVEWAVLSMFYFPRDAGPKWGGLCNCALQLASCSKACV